MADKHKESGQGMHGSALLPVQKETYSACGEGERGRGQVLFLVAGCARDTVKQCFYDRL